MKIPAFAIVIGIVGAIAQDCDNVFPRLSFGIGYNSQSKCVNAGGCWDSSCYFPKSHGYSFSQIEKSTSFLRGNLTLIKPSGALGPDFNDLQLLVTQETSTRVHIKIYPQSANLWEIPTSVIPRDSTTFTGKSDNMVVVQNDPEFELSVISGNNTIFALSKQIIFQEQYVQVVLGSSPDVRATFGFGESTRSSQQLRTDTSYTLWATDYWAGGFDQSLYGSHPFYIQVRNDGSAHGALFMNSNALEITLSNSDKGQAIGIQATGGIIDFYTFSGPTPEDVVRQYLDLIGRPAMVPYWALGFHNCRWGYENIQYVEQVVQNYSAAGIPLETQWIDIDYMQNYKDFTTDSVKFPADEMNKFLDTLHAHGQHFVPIVDPGIYAAPAAAGEAAYPALQKGLEQNVFITDLYGKEPYLGAVWPGPTYFPDWFAANATDYWVEQFQAFHDLIPYDGIWIDMNEVSNFCNAGGMAQVCALDPDSSCPDGCCLKCSTVEPANKYDVPPYTPHVSQGALGIKTVAMSCQHAGGVLEYNAHSLYGLMESAATNKAVAKATGQRAFVLSRSTFVSSGVHTAHWTGDNAASWEDLSASIVTMNNLALFGLSVTGADICGFAHDSNEELCARWIEVGAFSPFSRDHNELGTIPQELYRWDAVITASKSALGLRYRLLSHLYTLLYRANSRGDTVHNAMWMHFPTDANAFSRDSQFMWADGILFTPVLTQGAVAVEGYFPQGIWYPLFNSDSRGVIDSSAGGQFVTLDTPLESTNVHVRGGKVVALQQFAMTTAAVRKTPFTLLVAVDAQQQAQGELFLDDGVQRDLEDFVVMSYQVTSGGVLTSAVGQTKGPGKFLDSSVIVTNVRVVGWKTSCGTSVQSQQKWTAVVKAGAQTHTVTVNHFTDSGNSVLDIDFSRAAIPVYSEFSVHWTCV